MMVAPGADLVAAMVVAVAVGLGLGLRNACGKAGHQDQCGDSGFHGVFLLVISRSRPRGLRPRLIERGKASCDPGERRLQVESTARRGAAARESGMDRQETLALAVLAAAVVGGVSYIASWAMPLSPAASLAWKGSGVGLLAVYAALRARSVDGWLICLVMAFGALGDVLLGAAGLTVGALAFLAGHLVAIGLYWRNRRPSPALSQRLFALMLIPCVVTIAFLLPADRAGAPGVAVYALGLSAMASMAWLSRFPRHEVGLGALMFVVSDLLIFARSGPLASAAWVGLAIWGLYFGGQALIALGVTRTLARNAGWRRL
jgi:uncharacterized membrane protein YhhN